jgi:hypothetical protein
VKHALDELREVSLKLNTVRDELFELEMQMHSKRHEESRLARLWELAIDEVNRKAPAD